MKKRRDRARERAASFTAAIEAAPPGAVLVLPHDYPDPDALASAFGMQAFLERVCDRRSVLAFAGGLGRPQNRAMAGLLDIASVEIDTVDFPAVGGAVLMDTQPGAGNNSLPPRLPVIGVFDHHGPPESPYEAAWIDVRADYGSTSTIVTEYLLASGVAIDKRLACALLMGIRTDTEDLERDTSEADVAAFLTLFPLADRQMMIQIQRPVLSEEYFGMLRRALQVARRWGDAVVANLGPVPVPDLLSEVSELFALLKGADLSLAVGTHGGDVYLSLRTRRAKRSLLEIIRTIVGPEGRAGGHGRAVGGRLHPKDGDEKGAAEALCELFIESIRASEDGPKPVCLEEPLPPPP
ncbi:MAG: DHH family phosphoesterase [Planctomycetota bacterium]